MMSCLPLLIACSNIKSNNGTVDGGGGGNKICGRPIDAFRINITELPEYKKYIDPLFQYFNSSAYPGCRNCQAHNFAVGAHISYMIFKKGWYVVPCSLTQISKEKIGSIYDTEQVAIQTHDDIWMDQEKFNSLSEQDRGLMLFHEIVMGIKILKYDSYFNQCNAIVPEGYDYCGGNNRAKNKRTQLNKLTPQDYTQVRIVTNELFYNYQKYDKEKGVFPPNNPSEKRESNPLFRQHNFSNQYHVWERNYGETPYITGRGLLNSLSQSNLTKRSPQYANLKLIDQNTAVAQSRCHYEFKYEEGEKKLTLIFKTTSQDQQTLEREINYDLKLDYTDTLTGHYDDKFKNGEIDTNKFYQFPKDGLFNNSSFAKVGDRTFSVTLNFNSSDVLYEWSITEMICTSAENGKCTHAVSLDSSEKSQACFSQQTFHLDGEAEQETF